MSGGCLTKIKKDNIMKNIISYLILASIINFSFTIPAYCQLISIDSTLPEPLPEPHTLSSNANLDSHIHQIYRYMSLGVGPVIFIPNVGVGYRKRNDQLGWDMALSFSTIGYAHQLSAHLVRHYYLNRLQKNSVYLGGGLLGSVIFTMHKESRGTLSPVFVFGKELERGHDSIHFMEMQVAIPTLWINSKRPKSMYLPLMYVKYGIAF